MKNLTQAQQLPHTKKSNRWWHYHSGRGRPTKSPGVWASFGSSFLNIEPKPDSGFLADLFSFPPLFARDMENGECPGLSRNVLQPLDPKLAARKAVATVRPNRRLHVPAIRNMAFPFHTYKSHSQMPPPVGTVNVGSCCLTRPASKRPRDRAFRSDRGRTNRSAGVSQNRHATSRPILLRHAPRVCWLTHPKTATLSQALLSSIVAKR